MAEDLKKLIEWKEPKAKYATGMEGHLGNYCIFSYHWDALRPRKGSKEERKPWRLTCRLPGIKQSLDAWKTEEECKKLAEFIITYWLDKTGLTIKE